MSPTTHQLPATRCQVPQIVSRLFVFSAETLQPLNSLAFLRDRFRYRPSDQIRRAVGSRSYRGSTRFVLVVFGSQTAKSPRFLLVGFTFALPPTTPPQHIHQRTQGPSGLSCSHGYEDLSLWKLVNLRSCRPKGRIRTAACRMFTQSTHLKTYTP